MPGPILDTNHTAIRNKIDGQLMKESKYLGLTILGDGDTTLCIPFISMFDAGTHNESVLLDITDYVGHVTKGFNKDTAYVAKLFDPHTEKIHS